MDLATATFTTSPQAEAYQTRTEEREAHRLRSGRIAVSEIGNAVTVEFNILLDIDSRGAGGQPAGPKERGLHYAVSARGQVNGCVCRTKADTARKRLRTGGFDHRNVPGVAGLERQIDSAL